MNEIEKQIHCFSAAEILLPGEADLQRWAVIACDQFTSQPEYWEQVEALTDGVPSAFHLIYPECRLTDHPAERISAIHEDMLQVLQGNVLHSYPNCYIYTERRFRSGSVRCGLIGCVDLEQYDYSGTADACVRATEETVVERIPPRMAIRRGAALELPHVLLLCDDERRMLIEPLQLRKDRLPMLYDFDLMMGGGHITGWLVSDHEKQETDQRLRDYEKHEKNKHPAHRLLYAVGDGNHSLAVAKACYEEWKRQNPEYDGVVHPARFALCELNNIHDPCQCFEPIHRVVKHCNADALIRDLKAHGSGCGSEIPWISGDRRGTVIVSTEDGRLPLAGLQDFLDSWLMQNDGELDYIHGTDALTALASEPDSVGFCLPPIAKGSLFSGILSDGVLPRKTFSMGEAEEKRYYLEARRILP